MHRYTAEEIGNIMAEREAASEPGDDMMERLYRSFPEMDEDQVDLLVQVLVKVGLKRTIADPIAGITLGFLAGVEIARELERRA